MMDFRIPFSGKLASITEVPDALFNERIMGDGFAIDLDDTKVIAPTDGVVRAVFPTGHAVAIEGENGIEYLLHLGLETHSDKNIFKLMVKKDDKVKQGDLLIKVNLRRFKSKAKSTMSPIIFTSGESIDLLKEGYVKRMDSQAIRINEREIIND